MKYKFVTLFVLAAMIILSATSVLAASDFRMDAVPGCDPDMRTWRIRNSTDEVASYEIQVLGGETASGSFGPGDTFVEVTAVGGENTAKFFVDGVFIHVRAHSNSVLDPDDPQCMPDVNDDGENTSSSPAFVWEPGGIETQVRIACNPEWYGTRDYHVYWLNEYGVETLLHSDTVGIYGDISFVIGPDSYVEPFVLNTYIDGVLVQQVWVDDDGNVFYTGEGDFENLCFRVPSDLQWEPIPEGYFVNE